MFLKRLIIFGVTMVGLFSMALWPILASNISKTSTSDLSDSSPWLQSTITPTTPFTIYLPALMNKFNPVDPTTPVPTATITPTTSPTVTPTITPTLTPTRPPVEILYVEYSPVSTITGEYVDIRNNQASAVDMTNWTLRDAVSNTFTFPSFTLQPQAMVRVWVFTGTNDAANLYWGRTAAVWNNDKDTATLKDSNGFEIDQYAYPIATPTVQPTGTVTVTATPTKAPNTANVKIIYIEYAPVNTDTNREYVDIKNNDSVAVAITGWTLSDEGSTPNRFTFPEFTLQPGGMVRVWVITGTNDATNLYWGRTATVWNNSGDAATLKDETEKVVDYYSYAPTATPTTSPTATGTPTPTPTINPNAPKVKIIYIEYAPVNTDTNREYVDIQNNDAVAVTMTGWTLSDDGNNPNRFTFPEFTLQPGAMVRVWVITGMNDATNLYWGRTATVWNNSGDTATLKDATGVVVDYYSYTAATATPQPTATSSATPNPLPTGTPSVTAIIKITRVEYNPDGDDLAGEYVEIKNVDVATIDLTGWALHDAAVTTFKFPTFSLPAQSTVRVWVKAGTNDATNLYWGNTRALWNNEGDTAVLKDTTGNQRYWCIYTGQTGQTGVNCP